MSDDKNMINLEGAPDGASPPPPSTENAAENTQEQAKPDAQVNLGAQAKDQKKDQKKDTRTRVMVRSLTGSTYRRAGIEFDVDARAFTVSEVQRAIICADAHLEVTDEA